MFESRNTECQQEFWIETRRLPQAAASTFYRKLDQTLDAIGFTAGVRGICLPAYADASRGGRPGIDSSVIEANASLRELVRRNTEEHYWEYVKRLAAEAGIDLDDTKAVRRFDKKREGRTTSNKGWVNPHDPDAKVGMTKHGACDMIYKPEHVTDLESGAIVAAAVRCGDEGDTADLAARVLAAGETLARVCDDPKQAKVLSSLTADEGYFAAEEVGCLQAEPVRVVNRRPACAQAQGLPAGRHHARRAVESPARCEESERQGALAQTRRASRTELLPRARSREPAAGDVARPGQPDQAPTWRGIGLQPVVIDASPHRSRHAEAVAGGGWCRCGARLGDMAR